MRVNGSVVRIKLHNFLTYDDVEFLPGPSLNVIIGPNGTGKSSIICAIVLALGGKPNILGRAPAVSEFVKHGCDKGYVEIELYNRPRNMIIKRVIKRTDRNLGWDVNGKVYNARQIEDLALKFNIQVSNLCQFLPQDKVDAFSKMNMCELLQSTQKTIGGFEMYELQLRLIESRKSSKTHETEFERTCAALEEERRRNAALEKTVEVIKHRQKHLDRIELLEMFREWLVYEETLEKFKNEKQRKAQIWNELEKQKNLNKPLHDKKEKAAAIEKEFSMKVKMKTKELREYGEKVIEYNNKFEKDSDQISDLSAELTQIKREEKNSEANLAELRRQIEVLEKQLVSPEELYEIQSELSKANESMRQVTRDLTQAEHESQQFVQLQLDLQAHIKRARNELEKLEDVNNQILLKLHEHSRHAHAAVLWLRNNKEQFRGKIHEPIMTVIKVKDKQFIKYVESSVSRQDMLAFVCEDSSDQDKLLQTLREGQNLRINVVGMPRESMTAFTSPGPIGNYSQYGFRCYVKDVITCPDAVMRYLCCMYNLHKLPIGDQTTKEVVENVIENCPEFSKFYTHNHLYMIRKSKYTDEFSSSSRELGNPVLLLTEMAHTAKDQVLCEELSFKQEQLRQTELNIKASKKKQTTFEGQMNTIRDQKKQLLDRHNHHTRIEQSFKVKKQSLDDRIKKRVDVASEDKRLKKEILKVIDFKTRHHLEMQGHSQRALECMHEKQVLIERLFLATKELDKCSAELREKISELRELETKFAEAQSSTTQLRERAKSALLKAKNKSNVQGSSDLPDALRQKFETTGASSLEQVEAMLVDERTEVDSCSSLSSEDKILKEFADRQKEIQRLDVTAKQLERQILDNKAEILDAKEKWLNDVSSMLSKISCNFKSLFSELKCAGDVSLHVPENEDDFAQYGIKIRVKFRDTEPLQELSAQRHSGGERSVSTVVYMMALQEMTSCPFRCVDEINQGMDPSNERKIFDIIVHLSCKKMISQYFLLTPKLLPDLSYTPEMNILCVTNGKHNLSHKKFNIRNFIKRRAELD